MNSTTQQKKNPVSSNARFKKVKTKRVKKADVQMLKILIKIPNSSEKTFEIKVIKIYCISYTLAPAAANLKLN